ncbi:hypothetical protein ACQR1I_06715 [Bradyrhizobium sp. HKCCYLS2038]|uniref:hypothetical protein n=1 Tax=unclassified Bradyrhizobium TaxID=2631580 RepID=UPI003EB8678B
MPTLHAPSNIGDRLTLVIAMRAVVEYRRGGGMPAMFIAYFRAALDRTLRLQLAGAALLLTAGCSSVPTQTEAAKPPEAPRPGYAALHVGRPMGRNVSIFPINIQIDGKTVASLTPGRYTTLELTPGKHTIGVPDDIWSGATAGTAHPVDFVAAAGKTYYAVPTHWFAGNDQRVTMVGSAVVVDRVAHQQVGFAVQETPPAEFASLNFTSSP